MDLASRAHALRGSGNRGIIHRQVPSWMPKRERPDVGLLRVRKFRWAVQAEYIARRVTPNDLTGSLTDTRTSRS
jgi:hypothetical protein